MRMVQLMQQRWAPAAAGLRPVRGGPCLEAEEALRALSRLIPPLAVAPIAEVLLPWYLVTQRGERSNKCTEIILRLFCSLVGFLCEGGIYSINFH